MIYWTGAIVWLIVGAGALWLSVYAIADGLICARFVVRRIRLLPNAGFKAEYPWYSNAHKLWWRYFIGSSFRPAVVHDKATGAEAYWPGREDYEEPIPG